MARVFVISFTGNKGPNYFQLANPKFGRIGAPDAELSVVLVVSPLVSLMINQVSSLLI